MDCQCSQCFPSRRWTARTVRQHLKNDQLLLRNLDQPVNVNHVNRCIALNIKALEAAKCVLNKSFKCQFIQVP